MNFSESSHMDVLKEHITSLQNWLNNSITEASSIITHDNSRDNLSAWYHKSLCTLLCSVKGIAYTEYIGLHLNRKMFKDVVTRAVGSLSGDQLRRKLHLSVEEHYILEEFELKTLNRLNQEYSTLKDRIPTRIKNTRSIEYYLCDITADELGCQFPPSLEFRGAGAKVAKIISQEIVCGHIVRTDNFSEFYRCLVNTYGNIIPKQQQISREVRERDRHGK